MTDNTVLQYHSFRQTPNLWLGAAVSGLKAFDYELANPLPAVDLQYLPQRLGKRVEHFVSRELQQLTGIELLAESLQIQNDKQTIGEIDMLLQSLDYAIHLEIVYKFYLYDSTVGTTAIDHWIGPNRKDSFIQKLNKLQTKQFPLLYHACTKPYLDKLELHAENLSQQVLFKAQLFVPIDKTYKYDAILNEACIAGYYYNKEQLSSLRYCECYLPEKMDWLTMVHDDVNWMPYTLFISRLEALLQSQRSPLVWVRHPDGSMERIFVVWW